jgi:hypothetical protein
VGDGLALEIVGVDFGAAGSRRLGSWGFGVGRLHHFDFPQKAVTAARHRLDITRSFGRFSQRVAQPSNGVVDRRVELDHRFILAKAYRESPFALRVRRDAPAEEQNPDRLLAQLDPNTVLPEFSRANVELEQSEAIQTHPRTSRISHDAQSQ